MKAAAELDLLYNTFAATEVSFQTSADAHRRKAEEQAYWALFAPTIQDQMRNREGAVRDKGMQDAFQEAQKHIRDGILRCKHARDEADDLAKPRGRITL